MNINEALAQELHKPINKNSKEEKSMRGLKIAFCAADLAEMESLSSKNFGVKYLLCVIDVFAKQAWVKPLVDEKAKA